MKKRNGMFLIVALACAAVALILIAGVAQAGQLDLAPTVTEVNPSTAPNDLDTTLVITGTGFAAVPTVTLGMTQLDNVGWVSAERLTATVPWGLITGTYTLIVSNPGGESGALTDAFTVTQGIGVFNTNGPYGGAIIEIHKKPGTPTTVYALASEVGVFMSENSGNEWELIYSDDDPRGLAFDAQDADTLYYGSPGHVARSMDGGETWEQCSNINPNQKSCWVTIPASHPTQAGEVFAAVGNCIGSPVLPGDGGVFRSNNYGQDWISKTNGMTDTNVQALAIHPNDPDKMLAGTYNGNLYVSLNGGENWSLSTRLDGHVNGLYFNPDEQQAWASAINDLWEVTLYSSTNLTDWNPVTIGPPPASGDRWRFTFLPGTIWACHGTVYTSTDNGANWTEIAGLPYGDGINVAEITPDNPDEIYLGSNYGIDRSTDGGQSYQRINQGLAAHVPKVLAVSPSDLETVFVQTNVGSYRTFNGGDTWQELSLDVGGYPNGGYVAFDAYSSTRLYMGGGGVSLFNIGISPDAGATWEHITKTLPAEYDGWWGDAWAVASHPAVPGQVFAGVTVAPPGSNWTLPDALGLIYRSADYGQSWTHIGPTEPISMILDITFDAVDPDLIYVATNGSGVWKSTDGGTTWQATPLPGGRTQIDGIAVHPALSGHLVIEANKEDPVLYASHDAGETWEFLFDNIGVPLVYAPTFPPVLYGFLASGLNQYNGLMRSFDDGHTWEQVPEAPYPTRLATATDGQRVVLYIGSPGGLAGLIGGQATANTIQGETTIFGGGVYRYTTLLPSHHWVYLPLVLRQTP